MPNRIIKESICTSDNIDQLNPFQEVVFYRLIVNCDDFGRYDARAKLLSSRLFPLRDIDTQDIEEALIALQKANLIEVYTVDGKPYLQMKTWLKHQQKRSDKSKYPSPDEGNCNQLQSNDINCNQTISNDIKCPRNRERERNTINDNRESLSISENGLMDDGDAHEIQAEQNRVLDAAEDAGFKMSNDVRASLISLYADNGLQKMLDGFKACVEYGVPTLAYLKGVLKGGEKKPKQGKPAKVVIAQQYEQRDYAVVQDDVEEMQRKRMAERMREMNAG